MKKKETILGVLGIILLVVVAFLLANMIHESNNKNKTNKKLNKKEEEVLKVDGVKINFKTYRVDQKIFINIPDVFIMLDEATLKQKYNYNTRPELVFMSKDDLEHVFISTTNEDMTDDGLENYLNSKITILVNMNVVDSGIYKKYDKVFAKLTVTDNNMYYDIRYFTLDNKLVTVEFNSPYKEHNKWEKVIKKIMDSICFNEEDIKKY